MRATTISRYIYIYGYICMYHIAMGNDQFHRVYHATVSNYMSINIPFYDHVWQSNHQRICET